MWRRYIIDDTVESSKILSTGIIKQELQNPMINVQQIELGEEDKMNPYKHCYNETQKEKSWQQIACKWRNGQYSVT